jgi:ABC-2 type transport system permease protein
MGLADSVLPFALNVTAGGALVWALSGPPPNPATWPFVALVVLSAWLIDFCVTSLIGLTAFVTEDVSAFVWIYSKFLLILGGVLMPLDFMPEGIRNLTLLTPIPYMVYGPARLFVSFNWPDCARLLAVQWVWVAIFASSLALAYRRGIAWLTINGG